MRVCTLTYRAFGASAVLSFASFLSACSGGAASTATPMDENAVTHQVSESDLAAAKSSAPLAGDSAVLYVNGLGCPLCASNIDKQLERVDGVDQISVDLSDGRVAISFEPGAKRPSPARLGKAVEDAGFTLVKIESGAGAPANSAGAVR